MITLLISPRHDALSKATQMLVQEYGTATNIKKRVNRVSVLTAITSAQQRLKLYKYIPKNGLVILCGTILEDDKDKKVSIDFEPPKPICRFIYKCDNRFHVDSIVNMLQDEKIIGFIIIDGNECLLGELVGAFKKVIKRYKVNLTGKTGRGGQSALRFSRLREEERKVYINKSAELINNQWSNSNLEGIVIAGSANLKHQLLTKNSGLNKKIRDQILLIVDVCDSGENGFRHAISLAGNLIENQSFYREKKLLQKFFYEISIDSNLYCYGENEVKQALQLGAIEQILIYEDYSNIDWFIDNHKNYGSVLHIIHGNSNLGHQFINGFGGLGALLRFSINVSYEDEIIEENLDDLL